MTPPERRAGPRTDRPRRSQQAPSQRARTGDPARTAAYDTLRRVTDSDAYANLVLPGLLAERQVTGRDAAFATELTYGTLRLRGRYDAVLRLIVDRPLAKIDPPVLDLLRLGLHQLLGMRVPPHAAVSETVALARARVGTGRSQFVNAVLRRASDVPLAEWLTRLDDGREPDEVLADAQSHPVWIVRALRQALAHDARDVAELPDLLTADNEAPPLTLAVRPGLAEPAGLVESLPGAAPGRWAATAVTVPGGDPGSLPGIRDGRLGVQDEGSQLVVHALLAVETDAEGPERWLDLCAGPGGKAALLAAEAARRGATLVANEIAPHRADLVRGALRAIPDGVAEVRVGDGRDLADDGFDRVLVDAPCTGLGSLRRRPEARWRRVPAVLGVLTGQQRDLLTAALAAARPGGVVAYVTCSPHIAETDLVVRDVLRRHPGVERLDARDAVRLVAVTDIPLGPGPTVQLWPHVHGTDAMHLTLLRNASTKETS